MRCELYADSVAMVPETQFDRLFLEYLRHDWSWNFSDDVTERSLGRAQFFKIVQMEKVLPATVKLAALMLAFQCGKVPPDEYEIRKQFFKSQLT